ncbi:MAG: PGPGW domain-containing protein [bacterium]|jgi:hypothetical protein|nr:PGPGW domain-containing protein [bacterium]
MVEWLAALFGSSLLWYLGGLSVVTFVSTLLLVPWVIVRIPADYFSRRRPPKPPWADEHPVVRILLRSLRNAAGVVFILAGVVLLALPGQGLLTILVGLLLMTFPGKYRLERWAISRPPVLRAVNWLRRRAGRRDLSL